MFYLSDGVSFQRGPGSGVTIEIDLTGMVPHGWAGPTKKVIETDASGWASVLAAVCLRGEDGATHAEALAFHGDGLL